ncbi:hypothetical protein EYF80_058489 [Liparis tanakae]|uniref:Uncharacterized protein n=1 Tax=Liparis tanakae TaxID=230148 RepID=A0A4Z2ERD9_9TELE|nr:hypothetical protein EYF80_058489 [Liparis tanakae]
MKGTVRTGEDGRGRLRGRGARREAGKPVRHLGQPDGRNTNILTRTRLRLRLIGTARQRGAPDGRTQHTLSVSLRGLAAARGAGTRRLPH